MMALTPRENAQLKAFKVCVVGCGGLGGYVIEHLARLGIGHITAVDGDVFEESNLNRQLLSDESSIGKSKAGQAETRAAQINSDVRVTAVTEYLTEDNGEKLLKGHDIIIDALDNIKTRLMMEKEAQRLKIPLVHGAIAGWYGQVCVIMPGTPVYGKIYSESTDKGIESVLGNLSFTAAVVASIQTSEAVKVLLGKSTALSGKLLTIDLLSHDYVIIEV